jgi:hypothetical protein
LIVSCPEEAGRPAWPDCKRVVVLASDQSFISSAINNRRRSSLQNTHTPRINPVLGFLLSTQNQEASAASLSELASWRPARPSAQSSSLPPSPFPPSSASRWLQTVPRRVRRPVPPRSPPPRSLPPSSAPPWLSSLSTYATKLIQRLLEAKACSMASLPPLPTCH